MHILLTRSLEDSYEIILKFQRLGHKVSHMPVIDIKKIDYENLKFSEFKGIIFTSSNAIKCLNVSSIDKNINCFCVGSITERKARNVGFQNVYSADGNVNNLKELILQNFSQKDGKLLYVSGEIISVSLDKDLISEGYSLQRLVNYSADPIEELNQKFIDELKSSMPDIVYVYSQNSAKNFLKLIKKYQLVDYWMNTNLMCIGEKTSSMLNAIKWKKIFLFNPGEEEFLLYRI
jgi:uroporphyrinogen-III synthase